MTSDAPGGGPEVRHIDADAVAESGKTSSRDAALLEVARGLAAAADVRAVTHSVAVAAVELTRAFGAYVEGVEPRRKEVEILASAGEGTPPLGTRVSYPGSLTKKIIEAGKPEVLTELSALGESMAPYLAKSCRNCTGLITPLISEGDAVGALVLLRGSEQQRFGAEESVLARLLGDLASVALRRVLSDEQMREREERFRSLAQNAAEAIVTIDDGDCVRFVNPAAERIFGYSAQEMLSMPFSALIPARLRAKHRTGIKRYMETGERRLPWTGIELPGLHRNGQEIPLEVTLGEFSQNERRYFTGIMRDISDRVRLEEERERLQESKARLIRGFGHDVKNPLGAADGYAALLEDGLVGVLTDKQRESVQRIRRTIGSALTLIDDLVEFSKAEAGQLELRLQDTDPRELALEAAEDHRAAAETAGLKLEVKLPVALPPMETDPIRVRQMLGNLLSNAVKYTAEGGLITVTVFSSSSEGADTASKIAFAVRDTGRGIPVEQQKFLFQEFSRINPGEIAGAGLGLAISRRIARLLGGDITVSSADGDGSTFTLWLPVVPLKPRAPSGES